MQLTKISKNLLHGEFSQIQSHIKKEMRNRHGSRSEQQLSECSPEVELEAPMVSSESKPITTAANPFAHTVEHSLTAPSASL